MNTSQFRAKDLYENCRVRNKNGDVIFYTSIKRINWYLKRNLASIVNESPLEIQLNFETKGDGNLGDEFYMQSRDNLCVVCGIKESLTRHHVVPICFRKLFPDNLKNHSFHDILLLCVKCHDEYERHALAFKRQLELEYNAPQQGVIHNKQYYIDIKKCSQYANALKKHGDKMPEQRKEFLLNRIKQILNKDEINFDEVIDMKVDCDVSSQGELIVKQLDDLIPFIQRWRNHFIETMQPKFMPEHWDIYRVIR